MNVGVVVGAFENIFYSSDPYGIVDKEDNNIIADFTIESNTYNLLAATGTSTSTSTGTGTGTGTGTSISYEPNYDIGYYRVAPVHTVNNINNSYNFVYAHSNAGSYVGGIFVGSSDLNAYQIYRMVNLVGPNVTLSNITIDHEDISTQDGGCGGLVGVDASKVNYRNNSVKNSSIYIPHSYSGNTGITGGLVGQVIFLSGDVEHNEVVNCNIRTNGGWTSATGGLIGTMFGPGKFLDNKIVGNDIESTRAQDGRFVGGAIGLITSWWDDMPEEITNNVDITSDFKITVIDTNVIKGGRGSEYIGGFIGTTESPISISSEVYSYNNYIEGERNVGGIFGYLNIAKDNVVKHLYSASNVKGCSCVGGLVGYLTDVDVNGFVGGGLIQTTCTSNSMTVGAAIGYSYGITPTKIYRSRDVELSSSNGQHSRTLNGELVANNYRIIEVYNSLFDTIYGGDSNGDG